ncbi:MAG: hypothetical protein ACAH95_09510 [Fimbriimonas sp.]
MQPLERWLIKDSNSFRTTWRLMLAILGPAPGMFLSIASPRYVWLGGVIMLACFIPLIIDRVKNRNRFNSLHLLRGLPGKLPTSMLPVPAVLDECALGIEQIEGLLLHVPLDAPTRKRIRSAANQRFRRMLDLELMVPGPLGYSIQEAERQVDEDVQWLRTARRLLEESKPPKLAESDSVLSELHQTRADREAAIQELLA